MRVTMASRVEFARMIRAFLRAHLPAMPIARSNETFSMIYSSQSLSRTITATVRDDTRLRRMNFNNNRTRIPRTIALRCLIKSLYLFDPRQLSVGRHNVKQSIKQENQSVITKRPLISAQ